MDESQSLKGLFQGMVPTQCELLQGTVTSASPLKIQVDNDAKLVISSTSVVVPQHLTDYEVAITTSGYGWETQTHTHTHTIHDTYTSGGSAEDNTHKHTINHSKRTVMVHGALKKGDKVHLLAVQNGKKYFVLDRVG